MAVKPVTAPELNGTLVDLFGGKGANPTALMSSTETGNAIPNQKPAYEPLIKPSAEAAKAMQQAQQEEAAINRQAQQQQKALRKQEEAQRQAQEKARQENQKAVEKRLEQIRKEQAKKNKEVVAAQGGKVGSNPDGSFATTAEVEKVLQMKEWNEIVSDKQRKDEAENYIKELGEVLRKQGHAEDVIKNEQENARKLFAADIKAYVGKMNEDGTGLIDLVGRNAAKAGVGIGQMIGLAEMGGGWLQKKAGETLSGWGMETVGGWLQDLGQMNQGTGAWIVDKGNEANDWLDSTVSDAMKLSMANSAYDEAKWDTQNKTANWDDEGVSGVARSAWASIERMVDNGLVLDNVFNFAAQLVGTKGAAGIGSKIALKSGTKALAKESAGEAVGLSTKLLAGTVQTKYGLVNGVANLARADRLAMGVYGTGMTAMDAGTGARSMVMNASYDQIKSHYGADQWEAAVKQYGSEENAKKAFADDATWTAVRGISPVAVATSMFGVESAMAGLFTKKSLVQAAQQAAKGITLKGVAKGTATTLAEGLSEGFEEGYTQYQSNVGAHPYTGVDLQKGVGSATGLGAFLGTVSTGAMNAISGMRGSDGKGFEQKMQDMMAEYVEKGNLNYDVFRREFATQITTHRQNLSRGGAISPSEIKTMTQRIYDMSVDSDYTVTKSDGTTVSASPLSLMTDDQQSDFKQFVKQYGVNTNDFRDAKNHKWVNLYNGGDYNSVKQTGHQDLINAYRVRNNIDLDQVPQERMAYATALARMIDYMNQRPQVVNTRQREEQFIKFRSDDLLDDDTITQQDLADLTAFSMDFLGANSARWTDTEQAQINQQAGQNGTNNPNTGGQGTAQQNAGTSNQQGGGQSNQQSTGGQSTQTAQVGGSNAGAAGGNSSQVNGNGNAQQAPQPSGQPNLTSQPSPNSNGDSQGAGQTPNAGNSQSAPTPTSTGGQTTQQGTAGQTSQAGQAIGQTNAPTTQTAAGGGSVGTQTTERNPNDGSPKTLAETRAELREKGAELTREQIAGILSKLPQKDRKGLANKTIHDHVEQQLGTKPDDVDVAAFITRLSNNEINQLLVNLFGYKKLKHVAATNLRNTRVAILNKHAAAVFKAYQDEVLAPRREAERQAQAQARAQREAERQAERKAQADFTARRRAEQEAERQAAKEAREQERNTRAVERAETAVSKAQAVVDTANERVRQAVEAQRSAEADLQSANNGLTQAKADLAEAKKDVTAKKKAVADKQSKADRLAGGLKALSGQSKVKLAPEVRATKQAELREAKEAVVQAKRDLRQAEAAVSELNKRITTLTNAVGRERAKVATAKAKVRQARKSRTDTYKRLNEAGKVLSDLTGEPFTEQTIDEQEVADSPSVDGNSQPVDDTATTASGTETDTIADTQSEETTQADEPTNEQEQSDETTQQRVGNGNQSAAEGRADENGTDTVGNNATSDVQQGEISEQGGQPNDERTETSGNETTDRPVGSEESETSGDETRWGQSDSQSDEAITEQQVEPYAWDNIERPSAPLDERLEEEVLRAVASIFEGVEDSYAPRAAAERLWDYIDRTKISAENLQLLEETLNLVERVAPFIRVSFTTRAENPYSYRTDNAAGFSYTGGRVWLVTDAMHRGGTPYSDETKFAAFIHELTHPIIDYNLENSSAFDVEQRVVKTMQWAIRTGLKNGAFSHLSSVNQKIVDYATTSVHEFFTVVMSDTEVARTILDVLANSSDVKGIKRVNPSEGRNIVSDVLSYVKNLFTRLLGVENDTSNVAKLLRDLYTDIVTGKYGNYGFTGDSLTRSMGFLRANPNKVPQLHVNYELRKRLIEFYKAEQVANIPQGKDATQQSESDTPAVGTTTQEQTQTATQQTEVQTTPTYPANLNTKERAAIAEVAGFWGDTVQEVYQAIADGNINFFTGRGETSGADINAMARELVNQEISPDVRSATSLIQRLTTAPTEQKQSGTSTVENYLNSNPQEKAELNLYLQSERTRLALEVERAIDEAANSEGAKADQAYERAAQLQADKRAVPNSAAKLVEEQIVDNQLLPNGEKRNLPDRIRAIVEKAFSAIKNTVAAVSMIVAVVTGTNLALSQDAMAAGNFETATVQHIVQTNDNQGKPIIVADKQAGTLTMYDAKGREINTTPALFGKNAGDSIKSKNTTPSGRYDLSYQTNIDTAAYGNSAQVLSQDGQLQKNNAGHLAIHRVLTKFKNENRQGRLDSATGADNRISHGCINVPASWYDANLNGQSEAVVYVLPETDAGRTGIFANVDENASTQAQTTQQTEVKPEMENANTQSVEVPAQEIERATQQTEMQKTQPAQAKAPITIAGTQPSGQVVNIAPIVIGGVSANQLNVPFKSHTPAELAADGSFDTQPISSEVRTQDGENIYDISTAVTALLGFGVGVGAIGGTGVALNRMRKKRLESKKKLKAQENAKTAAETEVTIGATQEAADNAQVSVDENHNNVAKETNAPKHVPKDLKAPPQKDKVADAVSRAMWIEYIGAQFDNGQNNFASDFADIMAGFDFANISIMTDKSYQQSQDGSLEGGREWSVDITNGKRAGVREKFFNTAAGATPVFDKLMTTLGMPRIGHEADSTIPSSMLARIKSMSAGAYSQMYKRYLNPLIQRTDKLAMQLRRGYQEVRTDTGRVATLRHILEEGADGMWKGYEKQIAELQAQIATVNQTLANTNPNSAYNARLIVQVDKATKELAKIEQDYQRTKDMYNGDLAWDGTTPLPGGYTKQTAEQQLQDIQNKYGKDFEKIDNLAADIADTIHQVRVFASAAGVFTTEQLQTFDEIGYERYVPLYRDNVENALNVDEGNATATTQSFADRLWQDIPTSQANGLGLTRDISRYRRKGATSQAADAFTNLEVMAINLSGRVGQQGWIDTIQQMYEGTVGKHITATRITDEAILEEINRQEESIHVPGLIRVPAGADGFVEKQLKEQFKDIKPIVAKGYDVNGELKTYHYYFTDQAIQREVYVSMNMTDTMLVNSLRDISTLTRYAARAMTTFKPVWNAYNWLRDSFERVSIMLMRPVKDQNGKMVNRWSMVQEYLKAASSMMFSSSAHQDIYRYLVIGEVKTQLQAMLHEAVGSGAINLMTAQTERRSITSDLKKSKVEKMVKQVERYLGAGLNKSGLGNLKLGANYAADFYITRLAEVPQIMTALSSYIAYQKLGVNKMETQNRVRDQFDPSRANNVTVNTLGKFNPFVRSTLSGHYNLMRSLTEYWKPGERKFTAAYMLGSIIASYALVSLAGGMMGDDETGEEVMARLPLSTLMGGYPVKIGNGVWTIPVGFGWNKLMWGIGSVLYKTINGQVTNGEAMAALGGLIMDNTSPVAPASGGAFTDNPATGIALAMTPLLVRPIAEIITNTKSFDGGEIIKQKTPADQLDSQQDDFNTPDGYKTVAKWLYDTVGFDMRPETVRHLVESYSYGVAAVVPKSIMQDTDEKYLGNKQSKGEIFGPFLTAIGADIGVQPNGLELANQSYKLTEFRNRLHKELGVGSTHSDDDYAELTTTGSRGGKKKPKAVVVTEAKLREQGVDEKTITFITNGMKYDSERKKLQKNFRNLSRKYQQARKEGTDTAQMRVAVQEAWGELDELTTDYVKENNSAYFELLRK